MPLVNISLPRRLPDLDGDGMFEMVAACAVTFPSGGIHKLRLHFGGQFLHKIQRKKNISKQMYIYSMGLRVKNLGRGIQMKRWSNDHKSQIVRNFFILLENAL